MKRITITIEADISLGALADADRFGKAILLKTVQFATEARAERVKLEGVGFTGPLSFSFDESERDERGEAA